jgi:endonuclease/exonuclease/phosphatase family metal-dependent hydrolase
MNGKSNWLGSFARGSRKSMIGLACWGIAQIGLSLVIAVSCQGDDAPQRLRVLTYNIRHGEGVDNRIDLERIARVIRHAEPDLVALQEVDNKCQRSGGIDQTGELARLTKMYGAFGKQIPYEGGEYGQAILSRFPLLNVEVHWLPGEPERERRIAFAAIVDLGTRKLLFASTHLHHSNLVFREQQTNALGDLFEAAEQPVILVGDFNAEPGSRVLKAMESRWVNATAESTERLTFPSQIPNRQIDYVFSQPRGKFVAGKTTVIGEAEASDHRPLLVEFSAAASDK